MNGTERLEDIHEDLLHIASVLSEIRHLLDEQNDLIVESD